VEAYDFADDCLGASFPDYFSADELSRFGSCGCVGELD